MTSLAFVFDDVPEPGLEGVDRELVVELAGRHAVGGPGDALGDVGVEQPQLAVAARGGRP